MDILWVCSFEGEVILLWTYCGHTVDILWTSDVSFEGEDHGHTVGLFIRCGEDCWGVEENGREGHSKT